MGAWGMGIFDDDTSCDIMEDAIEVKASIESMIFTAIDSSKEDYIEYTECHEIIVAGAMASALINRTVYEGIENISSWLSSQNKELVYPHKSALVIALQKVIGEGAELNELCAENEKDYPVWRKNIESIISGLNS